MEIWKDINGHEGFYQVSNKGRVRSVSRYQLQRNGRVVHYPSRLLTPQANSSGYLRVELKTPQKERRYFVHRLVALHFVKNPNPKGFDIVNHIDSNYLNNDAKNLEWTNAVGNVRHAIEHGRMERTNEWLQNLRKANEKTGSSVIGTNVETGETVSYICLNDTKKDGFSPSCVCNCCKGKYETHKGYAWRYATDEEKAVMRYDG